MFGTDWAPTCRVEAGDIYYNKNLQKADETKISAEAKDYHPLDDGLEAIQYSSGLLKGSEM